MVPEIVVLLLYQLNRSLNYGTKPMIFWSTHISDRKMEYEIKYSCKDKRGYPIPSIASCSETQKPREPAMRQMTQCRIADISLVALQVRVFDRRRRL